MIVLDDVRAEGNATERNMVVLFGAGLIGSAVRDALIERGGFTVTRLPFTWGQTITVDQEVQRISAFLIRSLTADSGSLSGTNGRISQRTLRFFWSAGKAGFAANDAQTESELLDFRRVLNLAEDLAGRLPDVKTAFYLVSSAGGLFEGQQQVGNDAIPIPRRPYGRLKLTQEQMLGAAAKDIAKFIYRPSSVYGDIEPGVRLGLIPTLIADGVSRSVSTIFGDLSTLRDYVMARAIGYFLAEVLMRPADAADAAVAFLAAAKPSSIYEVKIIIERIIGRKLYLTFEAHSNALDNSFQKRALSRRLESDELGSRHQACIRSMVRGRHSKPSRSRVWFGSLLNGEPDSGPCSQVPGQRCAAHEKVKSETFRQGSVDRNLLRGGLLAWLEINHGSGFRLV
ncbi:MAG: NAD-dependent epimerase/dehydratase family protein [Verrucomicrobiota bacterium]|nr:NAD-dependent epimerase/dehydratase family protein [Verrucomicrobiota bacterium]